MQHYNDLLTRAHAKDIKTFGDIETKAGVCFADLTGEDIDQDMRNTPLYWCDGATIALEVLAEEGEI